VAVDTQNKRRSVHAYGGSIVYPVADGTISAPDREHATWLYAGIPATRPSTPTHRARNQRIGVHVGIGLSLLIALLHRT
jgi:hypothetical protein